MKQCINFRPFRIFNNSLWIKIVWIGGGYIAYSSRFDHEIDRGDIITRYLSIILDLCEANQHLIV